MGETCGAKPCGYHPGELGCRSIAFAFLDRQATSSVGSAFADSGPAETARRQDLVGEIMDSIARRVAGDLSQRLAGRDWLRPWLSGAGPDPHSGKRVHHHDSWLRSE